MKLKDILRRVDKSNPNWCCLDSVHEEVLHSQQRQEFGIRDWPKQERLKCYTLIRWLCTDTVVGWDVFFLDDEPVFYTTQDARKSDVKYTWASQDAFGKVQAFLESLIPEGGEPELTLWDPEEMTGTGCFVYKGSWLGQTKAHLDGDPVLVVNDPHPSLHPREYLLQDGRRVPEADLLIDFNLCEEEPDG
jgi:hypothetical protein